MEFSNLILQQVLFHHLVQENFSKGLISQKDLYTINHQREYQLNSIQAKLQSLKGLSETETIIVISQYFIDKSIETPFQNVDQLELFIKTLQLQLPKSFEPLMDAIRRKFLLYNIECFNHPYASQQDMKRVIINIENLSKLIAHCLIESDLDKIKSCNDKWKNRTLDNKVVNLSQPLIDFFEKWFPFIDARYHKKHGTIKENERYYMDQVEKHVNAMKALCIKLQTYLPRLSPNHIRELQQEHRVLLKSIVYRSIKYGLDESNKSIVQQAIHALPSQYKLDSKFDSKSLMVIIPTIGDILLRSYDPNREELLMQSISMALVQYGTITEAEGDYFQCRLTLNLKEMKALFKFHPFEISFKFHGKSDEPHDYSFKLVLNEYH
ncbi:MAG: hypothetical protein COB02_09175 [Candidatus Cloacimonadota bacterium]|nr:MAG: hypothetical protein COB02_09175 [Candidatus Cloacimonadota bacterium]